MRTTFFKTIFNVLLLATTVSLMGFSHPPEPTSCEQCTNTKIILNIDKKAYYNCGISVTQEIDIPNCYNSSGYHLSFKTDHSYVNGWYGSSYLKIPGSTTITNCNYIYGGSMTSTFQCSQRDKDGTFSFLTCDMNINIPKVKCNTTRTVNVKLNCRCN